MINHIPKDKIIDVIPPIDFVEFSIREKYLSRSDMWRIRTALQEKVVFVGMTASVGCVIVSKPCVDPQSHPT